MFNLQSEKIILVLYNKYFMIKWRYIPYGSGIEFYETNDRYREGPSWEYSPKGVGLKVHKEGAEHELKVLGLVSKDYLEK